MGKYRTIGTDLNRSYRNDINWNFDQIDEDIKNSNSISEANKQSLRAELARIERESKERDDLLAGESLDALLQSIADAKQTAYDAATSANLSAANAEGKGNYANTQGDYAKEQGDYAKLKGDYADEKAIAADTAAANANAEATNLDGLKIAVTDATQDALTATDLIKNLETTGTYDADANYLKNNIVKYDGTSYMAVKDSVGKSLDDPEYWAKIVDRGEQGEQGVPGDPGIIQSDTPPSGIVEDRLWLDTSDDAAQGTAYDDYPEFKQSVTQQLADKANQIDLEIERARISNLTANAGDTDGNAELLDIRVGFDGITYATAGEATRALSNYMTSDNESWVI